LFSIYSILFEILIANILLQNLKIRGMSWSFVTGWSVLVKRWFLHDLYLFETRAVDVISQNNTNRTEIVPWSEIRKNLVCKFWCFVYYSILLRDNIVGYQYFDKFVKVKVLDQSVIFKVNITCFYPEMETCPMPWILPFDASRVVRGIVNVSLHSLLWWMAVVNYERYYLIWSFIV